MYRAAVGVDRVGVRAAVEEELCRLNVPCVRFVGLGFGVQVRGEG